MVSNEYHAPNRFTTGSLQRFEIEGFRNLGAGAGINIKQLNLFVGPNGSGKSTMLSIFQLFHVAVLEEKIRFIDVELIDRFGLITRQKDPFVVRLVYTKAVFEYEYIIDSRFNWRCQNAAVVSAELEKDKRVKLIGFTTKEGERGPAHMSSEAIPKFKVNSWHKYDYITEEWGMDSSMRASRKEDRDLASILVEEFVSLLSEFYPISGESVGIRISKGVVLEYEDIETNDELRLFTQSNDGMHFLYFDPALEIVLSWLSAFNKVAYYDTYHNPETKVLCRPRVIVSTNEFADAEAYKGLGIDDGELSDFEMIGAESGEQVEADKLVSNIKRVIAFAILTKGSAVGPRMASALEMLSDESGVNSYLAKLFVSSVESTCNYLHWLLVSLMEGCSEKSHGLLPPNDIYYWQYWEERKMLRGAFNHLSTLALEYSVKKSLTDNRALRRWVLAQLGDGHSVIAAIPEVSLKCRVSFDKFGMLEIRTWKDNVEVLIDDLSRGEQKLILIELYRNFTAFLEEPESNLHPNYQSILGRLISSGYVSKASVTENDFEYNPDNGFIDLEEPDEEGNTMNFVWKYEAHRDYQFIETHSDILIKAIQLEMARNLPTRTLWEEHPDLNPSFEEVQKQFTELDPNIEVTYFGNVNGKSVPKSMGLRRDGVFREEFGPGFYDESLQLVRDIFDLKSQN